MAEEHPHPAGHPAMDYDAHEKTYQLFLKLLKYSAMSAAGVLILLAFLAR